MNFVPIGELVEKVGKLDPRTEFGNGRFTYLDIGSVSQRTKSIEETQIIPCADAPSRARQVIAANDVLVSTVRPNLNAVAQVPNELDGTIASTGFSVLRPNTKELSSSYLYHWVRTGDFVNKMILLATGQSYPAVSDKIVKSSKIPLPPLEEQRRIAGVLDQADALHRLRIRALDKLNVLGQAIFHEMFGDVHSNKQKLKRVALGELIKVSSGQGLTSKNMMPGEFPVYGGNGINGYHDEGPIEAGTIVIGRVGAYCGAVYMTSSQCWVTDNALIVKKLQPVSSSYLEVALRLAELNQYAGRAAQPLVSGSRIYPVEILLPSVDAQTDFEQATMLALKQRDLAKVHLSKQSKLFASLQHRAFRGEL